MKRRVSLLKGQRWLISCLLSASANAYNYAVASVPFVGGFLASPVVHTVPIAILGQVELKAIPEVGLPVTIPLAGLKQIE